MKLTLQTENKSRVSATAHYNSVNEEQMQLSEDIRRDAHGVEVWPVRDKPFMEVCPGIPQFCCKCSQSTFCLCTICLAKVLRIENMFLEKKFALLKYL